MPRRNRAADPVDMTPLINFIRAFIAERRRVDPQYRQATLARDSHLGESVLSELLNHPSREPSGRTLARLAKGMEADPLELYRIAYPRTNDAPHKKRQNGAVRLPKRTALLLQNDPQLARILELTERLSPDRRSRALAYVEGLAEVKDV